MKVSSIERSASRKSTLILRPTVCEYILAQVLQHDHRLMMPIKTTASRPYQGGDSLELTNEIGTGKGGVARGTF
jgi:hypothetical protein